MCLKKSEMNKTFKLEMTNKPEKFPILKVVPIAFRSWYSYAIPKLGYGSQHSWIAKLSANREKPIFSLIGFTLNGELITNNLSNLKVHMNSESYPYDNLIVDFSKNQYSHLYEMYTRFQSSYYNRESQPFLTPK